LAALFDAIWVELGSRYLFSAIAPIALGGGLSLFKPWLPSEDDIRKRVSLHKQTLQEAVSKLFHRVLTHALQEVDPKGLRGSPPNQPDIIGDHTAGMFRILAICHELDLLHARIRRWHTYLFVTAALGVIGLLLAVLCEGARPYVALGCYLIILTQLYAVARTRACTKRLEQYEKTT